MVAESDKTTMTVSRETAELAHKVKHKLEAANVDEALRFALGLAMRAKACA